MTAFVTPTFTTAKRAPTLRSVPPVPSASKVLAGPARALAVHLLQSLERGHLTLRCADGAVHHLGPADAEERVTVTVADDAFFGRLLTRPRLALGEGYTAGEWSSDNLPLALALLCELVETTRARPPWSALANLQERRPRLRSPRVTDLRLAHDDIAYHYDLGNDFYELFLDETMTYSSAWFEHDSQTLAEAQAAKYGHLCRRAGLTSDDHVLEIGCGWGGFAVHAAETAGCRVTAVTLSAQQADYARRRVAAAELADRVDIVESDYREVRGAFDKIVSIEMIEAVGHDLDTSFATCDRLLGPDGLAAIQVIAKPDQRARRTKKLDDGWIERYIFPGSLIPSITGLVNAATNSSKLILQDADEIGLSYARTLATWGERFRANLAQARALGYDDRFLRAWEFYLATAEAGFRSRYLRDVQLTFTRTGNRSVPRSR